MLTAKQIMTSKIVTIHPSATIAEAIELMLDRRVSGLPVVDEQGFLVGVITEFALLAMAYDQHVTNQTVAEHMTRSVISVEVDDSVSRMADQFIVHRVRRLPVVDRGRLVGLISRVDVLRALYTCNAAVATA
jgi:CBS domain-containing protein